MSTFGCVDSNSSAMSSKYGASSTLIQLWKSFNVTFSPLSSDFDVAAFTLVPKLAIVPTTIHAAITVLITFRFINYLLLTFVLMLSRFVCIHYMTSYLVCQ